MLLPPGAECLSSAAGRLCGCHCPVIPATLSLSVTLGHNCMEAEVGRWWGEEEGSPGCIPSAAVQSELSMACVPCPCLSPAVCAGKWSLLLSSDMCPTLPVSICCWTFEPEQPHKQIIKLFFSKPRSWFVFAEWTAVTSVLPWREFLCILPCK